MKATTSILWLINNILLTFKKVKMKNLRTTVLCAICIIISICSKAQNEKKIPINEPDLNRPKLFSNFPDKIPVSVDDLNNLFNQSVGRPSGLKQSNGNEFQFEGEVISSSDARDTKVQSVVLRSTNFNGATLSITKTINEDGSESFKGRIISFKHADLYELQKIDNQFVLVKRNYYDLVNE